MARFIRTAIDSHAAIRVAFRKEDQMRKNRFRDLWMAESDSRFRRSRSSRSFAGRLYRGLRELERYGIDHDHFE